MTDREDLEKIDAARSAVVSAILAGDADAYAACYTPDGVVIHPDSPYVRGRRALRYYAQQIFEALKVTRLVNSSVIIAGGGNSAYEVGTQEIGIEPADTKFKPNRQYLLVYEKQLDGSWKVAAGMSANS
jgi:uncharacterized protein (TIGR02246 family)